MTQDNLVRVGVLGLGFIVLSGCAATQIAYKPMGGGGATRASVAMKVVDQRAADRGGQDKTQVGQVRGSYGIPSAVNDSSSEVATQTITDATTDALRQAGVGVQTGGNRTLVATVKDFWMDGFQGYKATVTVQYTLQDASGAMLWTKEVSGGAGGALIFKSAKSLAEDMFGNALSDLAQKASAEFKSAEFQKALG